mmetsp:Transcript_18056/g.44747  ORF Transcript_18056/g.44747 Transcript_18056/m.44747 type:complete len:109 (-) Transcript_18056:2225-2551(-)
MIGSSALQRLGCIKARRKNVFCEGERVGGFSKKCVLIYNKYTSCHKTRPSPHDATSEAVHYKPESSLQGGGSKSGGDFAQVVLELFRHSVPAFHRLTDVDVQVLPQHP